MLTGTDQVRRVARAAIGRAKARGDTEVTPDDLLAAALTAVARFGVALVGPWAIDLASVDGTHVELPSEGSPLPTGVSEDADDESQPADSESGPRRGPRYSDSAVTVFEAASRLARRDGASGVSLAHLLAALGEHDDGLMAELSERHGFTPVEWRAALARGELGSPFADGGPSAGPSGSRASTDGVPEILDVEQAASFLGVHPQTVRNYIRAGKIPAYRLAGERFIRLLRRDLLDLLEPVPTDDGEATEADVSTDPPTRE